MLSREPQPWILQIGYRPTPHDHVEDFSHENGGYQCECIQCKTLFYGHKRRHTCKVCEVANKIEWDSLTPDQQEERRAGAAAEIFKMMKERFPTHEPKTS